MSGKENDALNFVSMYVVVYIFTQLVFYVKQTVIIVFLLPVSMLRSFNTYDNFNLNTIWLDLT